MIVVIITRDLESFLSPYLTATWDGAAGNGADVIYSRKAWFYPEMITSHDQAKKRKEKPDFQKQQIFYFDYD